MNETFTEDSHFLLFFVLRLSSNCEMVEKAMVPCVFQTEASL